MAAEVNGRLGEMKTTLDVGDMQRMRVLRRVADDMDEWSTLVRREKVSARGRAAGQGGLGPASVAVGRTVVRAAAAAVPCLSASPAADAGCFLPGCRGAQVVPPA